MDEMQEYEVNTIIQNIPYLDRNEKELNRYKLYVSVQANSKKKIKVEEIMQLPWDEENKNRGTKISEEEQKYLRDRAAELSKKISQVNRFESADMSKYIQDNQ